MLVMISIFLNLPRLDLWPRIWSILENIPCVLGKKVKPIIIFKMVAASHTVSALQTLLFSPGAQCRALCVTLQLGLMSVMCMIFGNKRQKPVNLTPPSSLIFCLLPKATERRGSWRTLAPSRDRRRQTKSRDRKDWFWASWSLTGHLLGFHAHVHRPTAILGDLKDPHLGESSTHYQSLSLTNLCRTWQMTLVILCKWRMFPLWFFQ